MSSLSKTWFDSAIRRDARKGLQPAQLPGTLAGVASSQRTETGVLASLAVTTNDSYQLSAFVRESLPLERRMTGIASYDIVLRALGCWT